MDFPAQEHIVTVFLQGQLGFLDTVVATSKVRKLKKKVIYYHIRQNVLTNLYVPK